MIREITLKTNDEKDWWEPRSSLVNRYVLSVEGEYWNAQNHETLYCRDLYYPSIYYNLVLNVIEP